MPFGKRTAEAEAPGGGDGGDGAIRDRRDDVSGRVERVPLGGKGCVW